MQDKPFLRAFVSPAALCAFGLIAALAAVFQFSLRAYVPGSLEPGGLTLDNFTALAKPLYARVFLDTISISGITAICTLILGYPIACALVRAKNPLLKSAILIIVVTPLFLGEVVRTY
jgi:putative spermidine/putrescine transport system permease protein